MCLCYFLLLKDNNEKKDDKKKDKDKKEETPNADLSMQQGMVIEHWILHFILDNWFLLFEIDYIKGE